LSRKEGKSGAAFLPSAPSCGMTCEKGEIEVEERNERERKREI